MLEKVHPLRHAVRDLTALGVLVATLFASTVGTASAASGEDGAGEAGLRLTAETLHPAPESLPQTPRVDVTRRIVDLTFPVASPEDGVSFADTFLALRGGGSRLHAATDLMAPKHRAVHAAVAGTITWAPPTQPSYGWMLSVRGDDGLAYHYVHLNNDTPEKGADGRWNDDGKGGIEHAYAPRIVAAIEANGSARGLRVERGELLGWLGDSGNAENTGSHVHFEIEDHDDAGVYRINPYDSLVAARARGDVPQPSAAAPSSTFSARFRDVDLAGAHATPIERLAEAGIVTGCATDRYCPHDAVTRGDLAAFVAAALELEPDGAPRFSDVAGGDANAGAIAAVDEAGILNGYGDGRFGPHTALSRAQLATMLVQAFDVPGVRTPAPFHDVPAGGVHAANIAAAHAAGLTTGCEDGSVYCGSRDVTRGQIASFIDRARA